MDANETPCCALTFLSNVRVEHTGKEIRKTAARSRRQDDTRGSLVVTKPSERKLAATLRRAGFNRIATIPRRTGHVDGGRTLGLWYKNTTLDDVALLGKGLMPGDEDYCCAGCAKLENEDF